MITSSINWEETDSQIWQAGSWLLVLRGGIFALTGSAGLIAVSFSNLVGWQLLGGLGFMGCFAVMGWAQLAHVLWSRLWPKTVRHAVATTLPDVVNELLVQEGSIVHGRLKHELVETDQGWEFRPSIAVQRSDKQVLLGFGIPFVDAAGWKAKFARARNRPPLKSGGSHS
jgi:hypothetical protein